jgi:mono/diheme cytochrome c family protein
VTRRLAGGRLPGGLPHRWPWIAACAVLALCFVACDGPGNRTTAELYPKYCARCHGEDGRGVPKQLARYPKADLTRSTARGGAAREFIYRRIAEGYGPMPAFARRLSRQEIERLVDYTLKLASGGAPAQPRGGS